MRCLGVFIALIMILLSATAFGFHDDQPVAHDATAEPVGLIVKFKPLADVTLSKSRSGPSATGIAAVDNLNEQFSVTRFERLLKTDPEITPDNHPLKSVFTVGAAGAEPSPVSYHAPVVAEFDL